MNRKLCFSLLFGLTALALISTETQAGYDPTIGRWLSRDPIGEDGGVNFYQYTFNNPINAVDPFGLDVYLRDASGRVTRVDSGVGLRDAINAAPNSSITNVQFIGGHGFPNNQGLWGFGQGIDNLTNPSSAIIVTGGHVVIVQEGANGLGFYGNLDDLLKPKLAPDASVDLYGCSVGEPTNPENILKSLSASLPDVLVSGAAGNAFVFSPDFKFRLTTLFYLNGSVRP